MHDNLLKEDNLSTKDKMLGSKRVHFVSERTSRMSIPNVGKKNFRSWQERHPSMTMETKANGLQNQYNLFDQYSNLSIVAHQPGRA